MDTARYFFGVLVVTFLPPAVIWWFLVHPFVAFWRRRGAFFTLTLMTLLTVAGIAGLMSIRNALMLTDYGTSPVAVGIAAVLFTGAAAIAFARRGQLTLRILAGVPELKGEGTPEALLTKGIYAKIRHPRYVEIILGTFAYATFSNHLGPYLVAFATIPVVHMIVLLEERELVGRFGAAYEEYQARVPRYLPRRD